MSNKIVTAVAMAMMASVAQAALLSGTLSSGLGEVVGQGKWVAPGPASIMYEVTDNGTSWHYRYELSVTKFDVSHFILETSESFQEADIFNVVGAGSYELKLNLVAEANTGMPSAVYGLKFEDVEGTTLVVEFDSFRQPIWGDFFAKGGQSSVWNVGFEAQDTDPAGGPAVAGAGHILVPDTVGVPEPTTAALVLVGWALLAGRTTRRWSALTSRR